MLVTVEVTEELLKNDRVVDVPNRCRNCPIALAINKLLKEDYHADVLHEQISIISKDGTFPPIKRYWSEYLSNKVWMIDHKEIVKPFQFDLDIPDVCLKGEILAGGAY